MYTLFRDYFHIRPFTPSLIPPLCLPGHEPSTNLLSEMRRHATIRHPSLRHDEVHRSEGWRMVACLRISESKFVLGSYPGKQTGRDKRRGIYGKIVLKQHIHKMLTYIREYVNYTFEILGLIFCFQPGLIFCFRPGLIFSSYWCGDSPSTAVYTSSII